MTAKVVGVQKLERKLKQLPKVATEMIREEMAKQAAEIVSFAQRLCPVDKGDLRKSIGWRWGSRLPNGAMSLGSIDTGGMTLTIYAGNDKQYYSRWVEFGTVKMRAQPYFFPAYRASRKGVKRRINAAVRKAARQVAGK